MEYWLFKSGLPGIEHPGQIMGSDGDENEK
jgi:hypothetical protein